MFYWSLVFILLNWLPVVFLSFSVFFYGIGLLLFISCVELISCPIILVLMQSCVPLKEHTGGRGHLSHLSPGDAGGGEFDQV